MSGRWKLFSSIAQEQAFAVKGGLLWFHHVLVAAVEVSKSYQVGMGCLCYATRIVDLSDRYVYIPGTRN